MTLVNFSAGFRQVDFHSIMGGIPNKEYQEQDASCPMIRFIGKE